MSTHTETHPDLLSIDLFCETCFTELDPIAADRAVCRQCGIAFALDLQPRPGLRAAG